MADACTLYKSQKVIRKFVASIPIPLGFKILGNGDDPDYPYTTFLTIDKNSVKLVEETAILPATVTVPDLNNPGQTVEVPCQTQMRQFRLRGPLFYNSVASGFIAMDPLHPDEVTTEVGECKVTDPTAFSSNKPIQIDDVIAYTCYECDLPEDVFSGFNVKIEQSQEFIINNEGEKIPHTQIDPSNFFDELKGEYTQYIYIPYTLALEPVATI